MNLLYINTYMYATPQKGNMAWEYNPFRNYQTDEDIYQYQNFLIPKGRALNPKNGELLSFKEENTWIDKRGRIFSDEEIVKCEDLELFAKAGSLIDLDTDKLKFDLNHPVDIQIQPSYDGSVNLILNDGKNIPRLINSRFSVREKNTYEIVDRIGENDTNIYGSSTFDTDTSLYFQYDINPKIQFESFVSGNFEVGQYCFYLTFCDADDNESSIASETGVIPVFVGTDGIASSMDGGIKNQSSNKGIQLKITDIKGKFNYFKLYYVRYFADYQQNRVSECKKIYQKYPITNNIMYIQLTGKEETEDIDPNILNITRFNPKSVLTSAQCKNMLFFGNIVKNVDNYKELTDLSLRIIPKLSSSTIGLANTYDFEQNDGEAGYYLTKNIVSKTGYFNQEFYRFGVVYIYQNGTLSNVYNTLGLEISENDLEFKEYSIYNEPDESDVTVVLTRNYIPVDDFGFINNDNLPKYSNARGVCKLNLSNEQYNSVIGVQFTIPEKVKKYLKEELGIRGLFFVRQKCIPNILCQCFLLPMDEVLQAPVIKSKTKDYYTESFLSQVTEKKWSSDRGRYVPKDGRQLQNYYPNRLYKYINDEKISKNAYAAICPDFLLNQPYFNQVFNGSKFSIKKITENLGLTRTDRIFLAKDDYSLDYSNNSVNVIINTVTEAVPTVAIKDKIYRTEIGKAEEVYRFRYCCADSGTYDAGERVKNMYEKGYSAMDIVNEATNLVRGVYSPYLAIYSEEELEPNCLYNIYQSNSLSQGTEYKIRMNSSEPFYPISDRYNFSEFGNTLTCYRGDCYINNFSHRLNRNFNDPSLPNNDVIIDTNTWKDNYDITDQTKWENISRSDVNAVQLGTWINLRLKSSMNYALRSEDHSYVSEEALMGAPRSFYPRTSLFARGENKLPESYLYNDAYRATLGYKCYFTLQDINYLKNVFSNRIQYSAISITDSFKNNYRYSLSTYFRDYSIEYGGITKLISFEGYLLVVFEHAVGLAVINERVLQGQGEGEPVFINTGNVLPEELTIISDTIGSQWTESVIKTEAGYVYGVDTVAKKIWRVKGQQLEILSDFKVNKFLIDNITLTERELQPTIGLKNVKTHYNNNKKDVMFTFYDDVYKDEEKVWNLCYNELMASGSNSGFITFYSWVPSYSENIDTQYFSFNRDSSKKLALLAKSNYAIEENTGILLDTPILESQNVWYDPQQYSGNCDKTITIGNDYSYPAKEVNLHLYQKITSTMSIYKYIDDEYTEVVGNEYIATKEDDKIFLVNTSSPSAYSYEYSLYYKKFDDIHLYYKHPIYGDINNVTNNEYPITFSIEKDHWQNCKLFDISVDDNSKPILKVKEDKYENLYKALQEQEVLILYITPKIDENIQNQEYKDIKGSQYFTTESVAITADYILNNDQYRIGEDNTNQPTLTTDFYVHGRSGIFDVKGEITPCYWYGEQHPFEFEFVVNDKIQYQKLFSNLIIIGNKATPESFHFEIEGDNYDWSKDKRNMYFRQEATKELYQNLGSSILFNRKYTDVAKSKFNFNPLTNYRNRQDDSINAGIFLNDETSGYEGYSGLVQNPKSTIFPLYYNRIDTYNDIYHKYQLMTDDSRDYENLSGSEIVWNRDLNQFNIVIHIKNSPIDKVGRVRGNSHYIEGSWNIQIPSITYMQKNEQPWNDNKWSTPDDSEDKYDCNIPPLVLNYIPDDIDKESIEGEDLPNTYNLGQVRVNDSWSNRKETKIRDKWIKIRVRYSGKELAIVQSLVTLYNISYA